MSAISSRMRAIVARRAGNRCEYCGLSQAGQEAVFHIDHVVPQSHGGPTTADNLALACVTCSPPRDSRNIKGAENVFRKYHKIIGLVTVIDV